MSTVDERVVKMEFDNGNFEKNAKETQSTLDKLKDHLSGLTGNHKLGDIDTSSVHNATNDIDSAASTIEQRFSAMDMFVAGIFLSLGSKVADFALDLTKSLTIEMPMEGWQKYENEMAKVSGMKNIAEFQGHNYEDLMNTLEAISWYADATSYSTDAMSSAMLAMMNSGVDLKDAAATVMGMANSFSYAGASATQMAGAFYMWSKALGSGQKLGATIYNSLIQSYGVINPELEQRIIDMAVQMGRLKKVSDGAYKTVKGVGTVTKEMDVSLGGFKNSLEAGWADGEVLAATFRQYGDYSYNVYQYQKAQSELTGEILTATDAILGYNEYLKATNQQLDEFGQKVLESASVAKMFSEVIDATKDAASSAWKRIFVSLFGDYEYAKDIFTQLNDYFVEVFASPVASLADVFEEWSEEGRDTFIQIFRNIAAAVESITSPIKKAFSDTFGKFSAETLAKIINTIEKFTSHLKLSEEASDALYAITKVLADIFKLWGTAIGAVVKVISALYKVISPVLPFLTRIVEIIATGTDKLILSIQTIIESGMAIKAVTGLFGPLNGAISKLGAFLKLAVPTTNALTAAFLDGETPMERFTNLANEVGKVIGGVTAAIKSGLHIEFDKTTGKVKEGDKAFEEFNNTLLKIQTTTSTIKGGVLGFIDAIVDKFIAAKNAVVDFYTTLDGESFKQKFKSALGIDQSQDLLFSAPEEEGDSLLKSYRQRWGAQSTVFGQILGYIEKILELGILNGIGRLLRSFSEGNKTLTTGLSKALENLSGPFAGMNKFLTSFADTMKKVEKSISVRNVKVIAESILMIVGALAVLYFLYGEDGERLLKASGILGGIFGALDVSFIALNKLASNNIMTAAPVLAGLGACILMLAWALGLVDKLKHPWKSLAIIGITVAGTSVIVGLLARFGRTYHLGEDVGTTFVKMGSALILMATALTIADKLENAETDIKLLMTMLTGMTAVIVALSLLSEACRHVDFAKFASVGVAFVSIGAALIMMSSSIAILGAIPPEALDRGGIAAAAILSIAGLIIAGMSAFGTPAGMLAGAASIMLLGFALAEFAALIVGLSLIPYETIAHGIGIFAACVLALGMALAVLYPFQPVLLTMSAFFASIGVVLIGVGVAAVGVALAIDLLTAALITLSTLSPVAIAAIIESCRLFLQGIVTLAPDLAAAFTAMLAATIIAIEDSLDMILEMIFDMLLIIIDKILDFIESEQFQRLCDKLRELFKKLIKLMGDWVKEKFGEVKQWFINMAKAAIDGLKKGFDDTIGRVIKAITNIVDTIVNTFKNLLGIHSPSTVFEGFGGDIIAGIKNAFTNGIQIVKDAISTVATGIIEAFKFVLGIGPNAISTVFKTLGHGIVEALNGGLGDKIEAAKTKIGEVASDISNKFKSVLGLDESDKEGKKSVFFGFGDQLMTGLNNGISKNSSTPVGNIEGVAKNMIVQFKKEMDINSPSGVFEDFGINICEGLAIGMLNNADMVYDATTAVGSAATLAMGEAMASINDVVDGTLNTSPTITPVVDLSEVEKGIEEANSMMPDWLQEARARDSENTADDDGAPEWVKVSREREARELLEARKKDPFYDTIKEISHDPIYANGKSDYDLLIEKAKELGVDIDSIKSDSDLLLKMYAAKANLDSSKINSYDDYFKALSQQASKIAADRKAASDAKLQEEIAVALNKLTEMGVGKTTNVEFVQNNYSPKALSNIALYRQTHNQLSAFEEVFG